MPSRIPHSRAQLSDPNGIIDPVWFAFLYDLFLLTGSGTNATSLTDLQLAPPPSSLTSADLPRATVRTATTTPVTVSASEAAVGAIIYVKLAAPGAVAVSLPAGALGARVTIKDGTGDASLYNITVTPAAGNIDGLTTDKIVADRASHTYAYTGTEWSII